MGTYGCCQSTITLLWSQREVWILRTEFNGTLEFVHDDRERSSDA
jgi:hypothetical protein